MTFKEAKDIYWKYYISLENQFMETGRYVELDYVHNGKTYSMEYLKLFQAVCSEIDVVGKALATVTNESFKPTKTTGINEWWYYIYNTDPTFIDRTCMLLSEHRLQPWKGFIVIKNPNNEAKRYILDESIKPKPKTPFWWIDYNSVKHNRTGRYEKNSTNYAKANLKNLLYAFAALYSLEVKLVEKTKSQREDTVPTELESRLFIEDLSFYTYLLQA